MTSKRRDQVAGDRDVDPSSGALAGPTADQWIACHPSASETGYPSGRKVHVEQQIHPTPTITSTSSARYAA